MQSQYSGPSQSTSTTDRRLNAQRPRQRIFIGPMPEKVVTHIEEKQAHKRRSKDKTRNQQENDTYRLLKEHAFRFFIHEGGKPEDWGEDEEQSITDEMIKRWKESEWGSILSNKYNKKDGPRYASGQWMGGSFQVGQLLGMDIMQPGPVIGGSSKSGTAGDSTGEPMRRSSSVGGPSRPEALSFDTGRDTFTTAPAHPMGSSASLTQENSPATSSTHLLAQSVKQSSAAVPKPAQAPTLADDLLKSVADTPKKQLTRDDSHTDVSQGKGKGKARMVHYADSLENGLKAPGPAPPSEVLQRTASTLDKTTSAAAAVPATTPLSPAPSTLSPPSSLYNWDDVVFRDRMLVRICYSTLEYLGLYFDDSLHRVTRDLIYEDFAEFLVVWRRDTVELYEDYTIPGKEWAVGHKHLAYVIPLSSTRTRLSLYSFVDLTFCLTCTPTVATLGTTTKRWIFSHGKDGTNVFIFKAKSRSRAYDWTWSLWRRMGGEIPKTIVIRNPSLDSKVSIDLPSLNDSISSEEAYRMFELENMIGLCTKALRSVSDWDGLIEREIMKGNSLQLVWRSEAQLDWVWLETDVNGKSRPSAVLCGLPFKQSPKAPVLEIRLAYHYPTYIHSKEGKRIDEPPGIEGYLERIKPNSQAKQMLYMATHRGYLFTLSPNDAYPPAPPGMVLRITDLDEFAKSFRHHEVRRGDNQIKHASGMCDMRSIVAVRRAFQVHPPYRHNERDTSSSENNSWFNTWSQSESVSPDDEQDAGGEEGAARIGDKARLRMRRSFELLLSNGVVVRFEAHSCKVAVEWIDRLRALIVYWRQRHRIDAKEEIELDHARRPRLTPQKRACDDCYDLPPEPPGDLTAPYPALNTLYNWCLLDDCSSIRKAGKVYMRKGLRGRYKLVQLFLVDGQLIRFRVKPNSSLHIVIRKKTSLLNAYVCSGYFAAQVLPKGEYKPDAQPAPRRYQDGLEVDDREEDTLFIVWFRPQNTPVEEVRPDNSQQTASHAVPSLSAKHKLLIFRTRSKLERDAWCWALNCEIEKLVRGQKEREEKMRESGNLVKL